MPFLRLTRDRRGHEHTFLMHQEPGQKPRVIYWYRTAPAIAMGRPPLDEEAIRTIEEQHPEIEFDWPAILALREVMTPEEESRPERQVRRQKPGRGRGARPAAPAPADTVEESVEETAEELADDAAGEDEAEDAAAAPPPTTFGLLDQLVGREIATRLRARHSEVLSRIHAHPSDDPRVAAWVARAEAIDPDTWLTPDAILRGVQHADGLYEALRRELQETPP